ncbi:hypothetical protein Tco_1537753, partial [Tanacetum coccineum]
MMKILRLLSDIIIKINYLLTAFALPWLCFAFVAADEDLSSLAVEDLHQQIFFIMRDYPSVLDMTVHTDEGSLLSVMCSLDDALPSSSPVTTSNPTYNSENVPRIVSKEKVKPTKIET